MEQIIGLSLAVSYSVVSVVLSFLVYQKRNHFFIKPRNVPILLVQNLGSLVAAVLFGLYSFLIPHYSCGLYLTGILLTYTCFAVPLLLRCWEYCVNFRFSLLKEEYRASDYVSWKPKVLIPEKFHKYIKWIASPLFLRALLLVEIVVIDVPLSYALFLPISYTQDDLGSCSPNPLYIPFALTVAFGLVIGGSGIGLLVLRSRDAYHGKFEIVFIPLQWIAVIFAFFIYYDRTIPNFQSCLILVLAYFATIFVSCALPLFYAYRFDRAFVNLNKSVAYFTVLLDSFEFRNAFHNFLKKQFCQENLQFYEVVLIWKSLSDNEEKMVKARSIITVFVSDDSVCQVNITADIRKKIEEGMCADIPSDTLFDEAVTALTNDMYDNSFAQFWVIWSEEAGGLI